jgi:hypothetical protein
MSRSFIALGLAAFLGLWVGPDPTQARSGEHWTQLQLNELRAARDLNKRRYKKEKKLLQRQRKKVKAHMNLDQGMR